MTDVPRPDLTPSEASEYDDDRATIRRTQTAIWEFAAALWRIREHRTYRRAYATFEAFCDAEVQISRPRAYQLIEAHADRAALSTRVDIAPTTEYQMRALRPLPDAETRAAVWNDVVAERGPDPPASAVRDAVTYRRTIEDRPELIALPRAEVLELREAQRRTEREGRDRDRATIDAALDAAGVRDPKRDDLRLLIAWRAAVRRADELFALKPEGCQRAWEDVDLEMMPRFTRAARAWCDELDRVVAARRAGGLRILERESS